MSLHDRRRTGDQNPKPIFHKTRAWQQRRSRKRIHDQLNNPTQERNHGPPIWRAKSLLKDLGFEAKLLKPSGKLMRSNFTSRRKKIQGSIMSLSRSNTNAIHPSWSLFPFLVALSPSGRFSFFWLLPLFLVEVLRSARSSVREAWKSSGRRVSHSYVTCHIAM